MSDEPAAFVPPPPPPALRPASKRRSKRMVVLVGALAAVTALTVVIAVRAGKPKGPPSAPGALQAKASVCTPPDCTVISGTVSLTWSAPTSGGAVTGYDVYRNDVAVTSHPLPPGATSFVDRATGFGLSHRYEVVAHSVNGDSPRSTVDVMIPLPPDRFAQLAGVFTVHLRVERASNLATLDGINHPTPGDTTTLTWSFVPTCGSDTGACAIKFDHFVLRPQGRAYVGSHSFGNANCFGGGTVSDEWTLHLTPKNASLREVDWIYTAFTGTQQVSFSCPNSLPSSATLSLTARYNPAAAPSQS